jgi:flagellar assembly protein FliH
MSSSDAREPRLHATKWSLDEFEATDIFAPIYDTGAHVPEVEPEDERQLVSPHELARIEAAAYARGRADGDKLARSEALPNLLSAANALEDALEIVQLHQARWMTNVEENIAVVAVVAARHIIAREVEADASIVSGLVQRALAQFPLEQATTVRLNPDDAKTCEENVPGANEKRTGEIRWTADPVIQRGGALVEGRERIIDGRVDTALERVYRKLGNLQA